MFEIDDNFLTSIGYTTATLTEEEKDRYKAELTQELQARISERFAAGLDPAQVEDFEGIQHSAERANAWLREFHSDFAESDDYKGLVAALGEQDAKVFYASGLWLRHAVPGYGEIIQETLNEYQNELMEKRRIADEAAGL